MRVLFKEKAGIFKSLVCLAVLMVLWCVFSLALPRFLLSDAGRIFAAIWAITAAIMVTGHARQLLAARTRRYELPPEFRVYQESARRKDFRLHRKITNGLLK